MRAATKATMVACTIGHLRLKWLLQRSGSIPQRLESMIFHRTPRSKVSPDDPTGLIKGEKVILNSTSHHDSTPSPKTIFGNSSNYVSVNTGYSISKKTLKSDFRSRKRQIPVITFLKQRPPLSPMHRASSPSTRWSASPSDPCVSVSRPFDPRDRRTCPPSSAADPSGLGWARRTACSRR